jgi:cation diffusion facilitator CzcD-associated flavoprotein CzcO
VPDDIEYFDVLIVGAGLSGVGAACRVRSECPGKSLVVLEGRADLGGTWDLFRYPGVRSDSDMYTLGYPFRPWSDPESIAAGPTILRYIRDTAREFGIDRIIRFNQSVVSASWSSDEACWHVVCEVPAEGLALPAASVERVERVEYRARFLYLCTGYYRYDRGHQPEFPGMDRFEGDLVHPQFWPEELDCGGKRVVVIGSGATAVTLVPAIANKAAHVTMLQRSPSYMVAVPASDGVSRLLERCLPDSAASKLSRWKNVALALALYQFCRRAPETAKSVLLVGVRRSLPGYDIDPDFVPRYGPWDQRLCIIANGDFFKAIRDGKASVVTDRIAALTESGIELESGRFVEADVIVSATGLSLVAWGGIAIEIDGEPVLPQDTLIYRGFMVSDIPNFAFAFGYTNASFTLRTDLSSRSVCRLLKYMDVHGFDAAAPAPDGAVAVQRTAIDLTSGYVLRALDRLPKQGSDQPWIVRQNYALDYLTMTFGRVTRSMRFSRKRSQAAA